jgi:ATP-binding cassette subfamily C protein LapB
LFDQVLGMELASKPPSAGVLAGTMREFESLRDFFTSVSLVALVDLPFVFLFIFVIWMIGGPLAIIPLAAVPIVLIAGLIVQFPLAHHVRTALNESGQKQGILFEALGALETIKSLRAEGRMRRQWEQSSTVAARAGLSSRLLSMLAVNLTLTVQQLAGVGLVVYGVLLIRDGTLSVGALIACVILSGRALAPLAQVAQLLTRLNQARTSFRALRRMMMAPTERPIGRNFLNRPNLDGSIEFRDVTFSYPEQPILALQKLSFKIEAGEKVGIIGRIGSGKSTIARLILGLYSPKEGAILIDGTDIRQIDPADLRRNIGLVPQDVVLFRGTVRENIAVTEPLADDSAILDAAKISGVDEFISQHPLGYDLALGDLGEGLSRGQRQTIALARTLLLKPPVLVLDEPSSAMDNRTENTLRDNLVQAAVGRTLVLITHRAALMPLVDRIIVLDAGRIIADGPRELVLTAIADGKVSVPDPQRTS